MVICDIGNTTFHFLIDNKHIKVFHNQELPQIDKKIYFISVNDNATKKLLDIYPNSINIKDIIKFSTSYIGIGIDRKVACLNIENAIIVDAGSAITVDIVSNSLHQGGFILPGIRALENVYPNISKALTFNLDFDINLDKLPQNTHEAINYALIYSIILPIKNIQNNRKIIFTGGDGLLLSKYFDNSIYNKNLIFDNIKLLLDKMALI